VNEDSAALYKELLKGLDKVKARAEDKVEKKITKSVNLETGKKDKKKELLKIPKNSDENHQQINIYNKSLEFISKNDSSEKINFKTLPMNDQDKDFLEENKKIIKKDVIIEKSFWEKLYMCGAVFLFTMGCFIISLFVFIFSFLFYRQMIKISNDTNRLESFLNDIWMVFSGGTIFLFIYLLGYFIKNSYKDNANKNNK
jgi:hypothetical protein